MTIINQNNTAALVSETSGNWLIRLWTELGRPHPLLTGETKRQARILLGMLVVLILLSTLGTVYTFLERFVLDVGQNSDAPLFLTVSLLGLFTATYLLSRTQHYQAAALIFVSVPTVVITIAALLSKGEAGTFFLYYMVMGTLFASLLLSLRITQIVGVANILTVIALVLVIPNWRVTGSTDEVLFNLGIPAVLIVAASMRQQYLNQIAQQITELEKARQIAQEARDKAEAANNAKSTFLSNMSHELRTPLNTIIGYTSSMLNMPQMYQGQPLPQVFRSDIALILENGQYLLELINDILDLSKIEADKFDLNPTIVDLNSVFKGVIATSIGLIKDKPIQIQPSFPEALPKVWADPSRVRQILLNLMSNAIKYTDTGTVRLQADVVDDLVRIQVIDTGVGIKPELLSTIFDRFKQAQTNTNIQGTGLGLDISQRLVAMHGGKITLKSVVGQGSTFAFTLPLATPEQLTTPEQRVILPTEGSITIFAPRKAPTPMLHTVLLVEDDAEIRRLIRNTLEREGCTVVDMTDGTQVVDMATGLLPDVLLLDVDLPDADVWGIVEALRADPFTEALPILFIGAHPQPEQAARLNISGALSKPIEPAALLQAVGQTLALPLSVSASLN